jgi:hypothetical protein
MARAQKHLLREQERTLLLQVTADSSLLRQKELYQQFQQSQHRLLEMQDSLQYRLTELPPLRQWVPRQPSP